MQRALIIGISDYPPQVGQLPAVAADVREIGNLLGSKDGSFLQDQVRVITDTEATLANLKRALSGVFSTATEKDTIFVYLAGHGGVEDDSYYFIPHDVGNELKTTAIALTEIRDLFDKCASQRAFLWLDCCHSGGILARHQQPPVEDERRIIDRTLRVVHGHGKLIFAACTPEQSAYEDSKIGHGLFTDALLRGLRGEAEVNGEVTANSVYDFIDRTIGSLVQRPMMFGQMTGRIVLMDYRGRDGHAPSSSSRRVSDDTNEVINSSGRWAFLGEAFYETIRVIEGRQGDLTLTVKAEGASEEAALRRLRRPEFGRSAPIPFAYRNDGGLVEVRSVEAVTEGDEQVWTITVVQTANQPILLTEVSYQTGGKHYAPEDFAQLRAGRILLNNPPPLNEDEYRHSNQMVRDAMMESHIQGSSTPVSATKAIPPIVYKSFKDRPLLFLQLARLLSIYFLKATCVAEEILELTLGPVTEETVHVRFQGRRHRVASNVEPAIVEVEGDCPLIVDN